MSAGLVYLYCVTGKRPAVEPDEVFHIRCDGIYALASRVKEEEFGEENLRRNLNDMAWLESRIRLHEETVERAMKNSHVIPFRFATVFKTHDSLIKMLKNNMDRFKALLEELEDKEEWGVKVYLSREIFKDALIREDKELHKIHEGIHTPTSGKAYLLGIKKEELINDIAETRLKDSVGEFIRALNAHGVLLQLHKPLQGEVTKRSGEMIFNAALLVEKINIGDFINSLKALEKKYGERGLTLDCTGPWPPYNFCFIGGI